jgi:hypothetical protein
VKRIALAVTVALAGCLAATTSLSAHAASTSTPPCTPKKATLKGKTVYYLCGPATATLRVGGKTYTFRNGYCQMHKSTKALELFLGTLAPTLKGNAGRPVLNLTAEHFGGTVLSAGGTVSASYAGKQLVNGLTSVTGHFPNQGSFKTITTKVAGTWNCHGVIYQVP